MNPSENDLLGEVEEIEDSATDDAPSEDERVVEWRFLKLSKLGLDDGDATEVAASDVDVHDVERLMASGCPLDLALRCAPDPHHRPRLLQARS